MVALILTIKLMMTVQMGTGTIFSAVDVYNPNPSLACNGRILNDSDLVVAHREAPCGTKITVCNVRTEKCVIATKLDAGPFGKIKGEYTSIIDISPGVAKAIKFNGFEKIMITYSLKEKQKKLPKRKKRPPRSVS